MFKMNTGPELYLFYSLKIEPFDEKAVEIKKNLNLGLIVKEYQVLKNEEVSLHFKKINEFCAISSESFIDTYYAEYEQEGHIIKTLFYKVNNSELLTPSIILGLSSKNILTSIHRTINLENNLLGEHNIYFNSEIDDIIRNLSLPRFYDLSMITVRDPKGLIYGKTINEFAIEEILKINLFDYQKDNINWMLELEVNPIYDFISHDKLLFFPDGRIYNYTQNTFVTNSEREPVRIRGGIILDNVGIGKTLQLLCLAMSKTDLKTIILVPDHLETHWNNQFKKHFNINLPIFIKIVKFSKFKDCKTETYDRIIVDEIHELYSNNDYKSILEACFKTGCQYKWGISATPFPVQNSIFNILRFLTEKDLHYLNLDRFKHFYDTYYKIFRKNTLENIVAEIKLPEAHEHNILLEFNDQERILYDAETHANANCDEYFLRKCCCDVMINFDGKSKKQFISLNDFNKLVINDYKFKYTEEQEKLDKYNEFYTNCLELMEKIEVFREGICTEEIQEINEILKKTNIRELVENINHYKNKIKEQEEIVTNRKKAYNYLYDKINDTNKECPICMCQITDDNKYDVPECGHICCSECMSYWLASHSSCSMCRKQIQKEKIYTITNLDDIKLKYSTKIDKLLGIIKLSNCPTDKFIIYTQFDNLISKLHHTLTFEGIGSIKFTEPSQIDEFKNNPTIKVLIISSIKNASGIDLSFVSNIIIFEPIIGNTLFLRDIEKQIIGRIYRINQTRNINIYRFIIKDTIEEAIFNQSIHNGMIINQNL